MDIYKNIYTYTRYIKATEIERTLNLANAEISLAFQCRDLSPCLLSGATIRILRAMIDSQGMW